MRFLDEYRSLFGCENIDQLFEYFVDNFTQSVTSWEYFINWQKVFSNFKEYEYGLHLLDVLVGKPNVEHELRLLIKKHPETAKLLPV